MEDDFKYDVFLSSASADKDFVMPIWKEMVQAGLRVYFADENLQKSIGQSFVGEIQNALIQSQHFVLICTPNSMNSEWVKEEYESFWSECHMENRSERLFIIFPGNNFDESTLPLFLKRIHRPGSVKQIISTLGGVDIQVLKKENQVLKKENRNLQKKVEKSNLEKKRLEAKLASLKNPEIDLNNYVPRKKYEKKLDVKKNLKREIIKLTNSEDTRKAGTGDLRQTMDSRMIEIPAGTVLMKDKDSRNEFTAEINVFFMDKFPVTQDLYERVMGEAKNRSKFRGGDRPVENVSWFEAVVFCNLLSDEVELKRVYTIKGDDVTADWKADGFRLPTEAEWEYACRAGTTGERYGKVDKIAWYKDNSNGSTHGVGKKESNPWGLYDMLGNVWEWCWDWKGDYPKESKKYWRGPDNDRHRVCRGGSWDFEALYCASAIRGSNYPTRSRDHLGFRLARSL